MRKTLGLSAAGLSFSQFGLEWIIGLLVPLVLLCYAVQVTGKSSILSLAAIAAAFAEKFNLVVGGRLISRASGILPQEARHIWGRRHGRPSGPGVSSVLPAGASH